MNSLDTKTIREIALENPATVPVFEEFRIDYCCGGKRLFEDACAAAGASPEIVGQKIAALLNASNNVLDDSPEKKTPTDLIDYIVGKHHVFTKKEIERLTPLMEKVCRKHGGQHVELLELQNAFQELCNDLTAHLQKEEMVLFPYIKRVEAAVLGKTAAPFAPFVTVKNPVRVMLFEHDTAGELLEKMRRTSNNYALPEGACPSFTALYFGLQALEKDLHRHIHLENNVLFPQAIELEQKAFGDEIELEDSDYVCARTVC